MTKTSKIFNYNKILIEITKLDHKNIVSFYYQHNKYKHFSLLEILEKYQIKINFQCRSGYCGVCKITLLKGQIKYYREPLASCINNNEILSCCCIPVENIKLNL